MIFETDTLYIEKQESQIPWLKIFTKEPYTELSQVPMQTQISILTLLNSIELEMIQYYQPRKINIASFGNYMPQQHWHIMARFSDDDYLPEPMWGEKQRESTLGLPSFDIFVENLQKRFRALS